MSRLKLMYTNSSDGKHATAEFWIPTAWKMSRELRWTLARSVCGCGRGATRAARVDSARMLKKLMPRENHCCWSRSRSMVNATAVRPPADDQLPFVGDREHAWLRATRLVEPRAPGGS